jgi:hypothetical protein
MSWSLEFEDEIKTPAGNMMRTLKDAADYIRKLSQHDQQSAHWELAIETLIMAAEKRGPILHAQIAMNRALAHGLPRPEKTPRRKAPKVYKIVR